MGAQRPTAKFSAGQVACAVWENEIDVSGRAVRVKRATLERRFKDTDGQWKSSGSFSRNDIPLAIYCLQQAFGHMLGGSRGESDGEDPAP